MVLLHLAPSIQEYLLFLSAADARFISELELRKIAREPRWDRQCELLEQQLQKYESGEHTAMPHVRRFLSTFGPS